MAAVGRVAALRERACRRHDSTATMHATTTATTMLLALSVLPLLLLLLQLQPAAARRNEQDFEFDDAAPGRRPRRYIYDPGNPLCAALRCIGREACVLRDGRTALCADENILRRGDTLVVASGSAAHARDEEDVFYDSHADSHDSHADSHDPEAPSGGDYKPDRCVGCGRRRGFGAGGAGAASFLCGSDNRTYSSLCRLDLHNCVRRPRPPVTLACKGFCPCDKLKVNRRCDKARARRPPALDLERNEVWSAIREPTTPELPLRPPNEPRVPEAGGEDCVLERMADRLLDWFSVLMDNADAPPLPPSPRPGFPRDCKPEVRWMFAHLDTDGDGLLSSRNLYALRHDPGEKCLRPFLTLCGIVGGTRVAGGAGLSRAAWCGCLRRAARPCLALARAHPSPGAGGYVPSCDARGFYRPRQCHPALGVCWCVSPHGVELAGSRTKGAPSCPQPDAEAEAQAKGESDSEAPADDEDAEQEADADGSGAGPELRF